MANMKFDWEGQTVMAIVQKESVTDINGWINRCKVRGLNEHSLLMRLILQCADAYNKITVTADSWAEVAHLFEDPSLINKGVRQ